MSSINSITGFSLPENDLKIPKLQSQEAQISSHDPQGIAAVATETSWVELPKRAL